MFPSHLSDSLDYRLPMLDTALVIIRQIEHKKVLKIEGLIHDIAPVWSIRCMACGLYQCFQLFNASGT